VGAPESQGSNDNMRHDLNEHNPLQNCFHITDTDKESPSEWSRCGSISSVNSITTPDTQDTCSNVEILSQTGNAVDDHVSSEHDNKLEKWAKYNEEFVKQVDPLYKMLQNKEKTAVEAATEFNQMLFDFLKEREEVKKEAAKFFKHKAKSTKEIYEARKVKNKLKKTSKKKGATDEDKSDACKALRHYEYLLEEKETKEEANELKRQEKDYKKNFFKFAKEVTQGTYGKPSNSPTYSKEKADKYYTDKYSKAEEVDLDKLDWFPEAQAPQIPYDLSPYSAEDIQTTLKNKKQDSAPGDDEIVY